MNEALTVHCDRCGIECAPPSDEAIKEWEQTYGKESPPMLCHGCVADWKLENAQEKRNEEVFMSVYQEFREDVQRRQKRVARQQFWIRARRELQRDNYMWTGIFLLTLTLPLLLAIARGLGIVK